MFYKHRKTILERRNWTGNASIEWLEVLVVAKIDDTEMFSASYLAFLLPHASRNSKHACYDELQD